MEYRREIDGVRALAVVPVILQHAKFSFIPGGFTGVDIFFVISGFLISSIIYSDAINGRFSIIDFYERRARRIIPALIVVILATTIASYFFMMPDNFKTYGQSVVATLLFGNNVLLALTSGYWSLASEFKPLLHTWSLGVEEQFYVIYPVLVFIIVKYNKKLFVPTLVILFALSLLMSIFLTRRYPDASFYLLHTRAWELLLGALTGYYLFTSRRRRGNDVLAGIGLLLIVAGFAFIKEGMPYPYVYALLPCIGTSLLLIYARGDTLVGRLLSLPPFVAIGLMSYSAYLWHQPLLSLARIASVNEPPTWLYAVLVALTLVLAHLTLRYVEQPFRNRRLFTSRQIFMGTAVSSILLASVGFVIARSGGLPGRVPGLGLSGANYIAYNEQGYRYRKSEFAGDHPRKLLVIGDSTARDFINVMNESGLFRQYEIAYRDDGGPCKADLLPRNKELIQSADAVVFVASWSYDPMCRPISLEDPLLKGKPSILVGPKHFGYNLDAYIFTSRSARPLVRASLLESTIDDDARFSRIVPPDAYVDLLKLMDERFGGVPVFDGEGHILSVDRVHLTKAGAQLFASFIFDDPAWRMSGILPANGRQQQGQQHGASVDP